MPSVLFAGYKSPHPLEPHFELRVGTDGSLTPKEAVVECCAQLVRDLDTVRVAFTTEVELYNIAKKGAGNGGF